MSRSAAEQVAALRTLVEQAKAMPMSASCLVNRSEVLGLLDALAVALRDEQAAARRESGADSLAEATERADRILAQARARAANLVAHDAVHAEAIARASELAASTREESDALRREADAYVDQRMAELEASLSKTLSQLKTMRARLSQRSGLDEPAD